MVDTVVELAKKTKAEIERRGWYQGWYLADSDNPDACPVCLYGAINAVVNGNPEQRALGGSSELLVHELSDLAGEWLSSWNDTEGRTVEEVYALLDSVINDHNTATA